MMLLAIVKKVAAGGAVVGSAAGLTWVSTGPLVGVALAEPRAWIDEPLDGATLAPGEEIMIVAHATDPDGVDLVTLRIDGKPVEARTGGGHPLTTVEFEWVPPTAGEYALEVRGRDDSDFGAPGLATVTVADPPEVDEPGGDADDQESTTTTTSGTTTTTTGSDSTTSTSAATTTTRPVVTVLPSTPTTRPPPPTTQCQQSPPTLVSPLDRASLRISPTLAWSHQGCAVDGFRVKVARTPDGTPIATSPTLGPSVRSWAPRGGFPCDGRPVYWQVATIDGRALRWSGVWSFTC